MPQGALDRNKVVARNGWLGTEDGIGEAHVMEIISRVPQRNSSSTFEHQTRWKKDTGGTNLRCSNCSDPVGHFARRLHIIARGAVYTSSVP